MEMWTKRSKAKERKEGKGREVKKKRKRREKGRIQEELSIIFIKNVHLCRGEMEKKIM